MTEPAPKPAKAPNTFLVGLGLAVTGAVGTAVNWYSILTDGSYWIVMSVFGPTLLGLGLGILLAPDLPPPGEKRSPANAARRYAAIAVIALGMVAGIVNLAMFSGLLPLPFTAR